MTLLSEWQPVTTAPKDGREILIVYPAASGRRVTAARWHTERGPHDFRSQWHTLSVWLDDSDIAAWMPMPAADDEDKR
jgi:hypothetical protein